MSPLEGGAAWNLGWLVGGGHWKDGYFSFEKWKKLRNQEKSPTSLSDPYSRARVTAAGQGRGNGHQGACYLWSEEGIRGPPSSQVENPTSPAALPPWIMGPLSGPRHPVPTLGPWEPQVENERSRGKSGICPRVHNSTSPALTPSQGCWALHRVPSRFIWLCHL